MRDPPTGFGKSVKNVLWTNLIVMMVVSLMVFSRDEANDSSLAFMMDVL